MERATVSWWKHALAVAILAAGVLLAYSNSFTAGFARDSRLVVLEDPRVQSLTRQHVKDIFEHGYLWPAFDSGLYRPVSSLSYLFNYAWMGEFDRPAGYHWINALLHLANAVWVYLLALLLARRYWPAVFAAALWALHPIATEAVTNIAGRPEELAALGVLCALVLYIRGSRPSWRNFIRLAATLAAATLAVFSKESGVVVLPLAVLYDFAFRTRRDWKGYVCLGMPVAGLLAARWAVLRHEGVMELPFVNNPISGAGFLAGRATAIGVAGKYLWLLIWPLKLSCDYSYNQVPLFQWHSITWQQGASVAIVVGLLALAAVCYHRHRVGFFLLGFSAVALLPAANLLVNTGTIMAERLLYLPSVGFAAAVSFGAYRLASRAAFRPMAAALVLSAIVASYAARTWRRNPDWLNNETLYASAVAVTPANFEPHIALAEEWYRNDPTFLQGDRAVTEAEKGVALIDKLPDSRTPSAALMVLGKLYCARGDVVAARDAAGNPHADAASGSWYQKALEIDLRAVSANRAFEQERQRRELARGTPPDAIVPKGLPEIYANLGDVYLRLGDPARAFQVFREERRLEPRSSQPYLSMAAADRALNQPEGAATDLLEAYILNKSQAILASLGEAYGPLPAAACAVSGQSGRRSLNLECAIVRRDLCLAYADLEGAFRDAKNRDSAEQVREAARKVPGCL